MKFIRAVIFLLFVVVVILGTVLLMKKRDSSSGDADSVLPATPNVKHDTALAPGRSAITPPDYAQSIEEKRQDVPRVDLNAAAIPADDYDRLSVDQRAVVDKPKFEEASLVLRVVPIGPNEGSKHIQCPVRVLSVIKNTAAIEIGEKYTVHVFGEDAERFAALGECTVYLAGKAAPVTLLGDGSVDRGTSHSRK